MDPFKSSISVGFVCFYSWPNLDLFSGETAEEPIEWEINNALLPRMTYRHRISVLGSRFSTKYLYFIPPKSRLPSCGCFEASSNERTFNVLPCEDCIALEKNIVCNVAQKVVTQGIKSESAIRTNLLMHFASAEFHFISIMIFCFYLTFLRHTFSHQIVSFRTTFGKCGFVGTKNMHSMEEIDADGDDHRKSNRSDSKGGSGEETSSGSGSSGGVYVSSGGAGGSSSAGGDDGDDEHGSRKELGGPQCEDHMEADENEDEAKAEELEDDEESDPNKKKMVGGCGRFGNFMRRRLEEEQEKEEAERHRQAMISHYEAWKRSNAAARAYVRKNIAKVEPEAYCSGVASGSSDVYDPNHPAFTMAFAAPVPIPGSRFLNLSEPVSSSSPDVGDDEQAVSNVAPTVSKLEEEDPEADRERSVSPDIPTEGAPSRSPSPPREALR